MPRGVRHQRGEFGRVPQLSSRLTVGMRSSPSVVVSAVTFAGGGSAGAATVRAQSVGRFLDGSAGGMALQSLVDLKDARAKAAPSTSKRQGVNAELFDAGTVPIGNGLKLPGGGVFDLGAANQIAVAKTDGYSYGASGAVENNGGIQLTDKNGRYPSGATINLSGAALGSVAIPGLPTTIPGLPTGTGSPVPSAAALGGVVAKVGAVQALAQTGAGGKSVKPQSSVADLQLAIASPALGALLTQLDDAFKTDVVGGLTSAASNPALTAALKALTGGVKGCSLTAPTSTTITLEGGGVVIDPATATITIDLKILLKRLAGINIAHLSTSNFDLITFLVQKLPTILSKGLESVVNGLTGSLEGQFTACSNAITTALGALPVPIPVPAALSGALTSLQGTIEAGINSVADPLISASSGGLATLANGLTGAVDIGLNVQSGPKIQPHNTQYKYTSKLAKTPDQATSVVKHQSLVRAIEIDLLDAAGSAGTGSGLPTTLPSLPATNAVASHQLAGAHHAAAAGGAAVSLAMGNAAAGPSVAAPKVARTTTSPTTATGTSLPTGVPAGAAGRSDGGSPLLPVGLLLLGLVIAGGGVLSVRTRTRGKFSR